MKRAVAFLSTMALAVLAAIPAVAAPPATEVWSYEEEFDFEGPICAGDESLVLEATVTVRDIIFFEGDEGSKVVSTIGLKITGPEPWSGQGTQTLLTLNGERTLSWQFIATNADTDQKIRFHANVQFPEDGDPELEPPFGLHCIRP